MTRRASGALGVTTLVSGDHFLSHVYILAFPPLFPLIAGAFDVSVTRLAVSVTLIYAAQFLCQVPAGELVDRVGGKRAVVVGLAVTATSIAAAGFATTYLHILVCAFVSGVGQSPFHPGNYALLDAAGDAASEGKQFSVHSFGGFIGFAAAPVLTTGIAALADWRTALVVVGAVGLAYAGVLAVALAPVHRRALRAVDAGGTSADGMDGRSPFASVRLLTRPLVAGMFAFFLLVTFADTGVQTYTTAFAVQHLGLSTVIGNTALTALLGVTAVTVLLGGWLADRYDAFTIIVVGLSWTALVLGASVAFVRFPRTTDGPAALAFRLTSTWVASERSDPTPSAASERLYALRIRSKSDARASSRATTASTYRARAATRALSATPSYAAGAFTSSARRSRSLSASVAAGLTRIVPTPVPETFVDTARTRCRSVARSRLTHAERFAGRSPYTDAVVRALPATRPTATSSLPP